MKPLILFCSLVCACMFSIRAEEQRVNIDELPHKMIELPNGSKAEVIQYSDHWWRVIDVTVLSSSDDHDPDVCFEAKYDMLVGAEKLKLFGVSDKPTPNDPTRPWASIIIEDKLKR